MENKQWLTLLKLIRNYEDSRQSVLNFEGDDAFINSLKLAGYTLSFQKPGWELEAIRSVIQHLNAKLGEDIYKIQYPSKNGTLIIARIKEGYTVENIIEVINEKCNEWLNTENDKYLRIETLCHQTKFSAYIAQVALRKKRQPAKPEIGYESRQLREMAQDPQFRANIMATIVGWRTGVGCQGKSGKIIEDECNFLAEAYGNVTAKELDTAISLAITRKLDISYPHHIVFSPFYMSEVLNSFQKYKTARLPVNIIKNQPAAAPLPPPVEKVPISLKERIETMEWNISTVYEKTQSVISATTLLYMPIILKVFRYLKYIGEITITDETELLAIASADKMFKSSCETSSENMSQFLKENPLPEIHLTFKYIFYLTEYFKGKSLEQVVKLIKEEHFIKK